MQPLNARSHQWVSLLLISSFLFWWHCSPKSTPPITVLQNGQWTELTSSDGSEPVERHEAAFVGVGDKFYLLGGRGMKPASIYDTKTRRWTLGPVPPIELHHFQPVVYQNDIYIMGAMTGPYPGEDPVPNIYIYRTATDTWDKGPAIPADRLRGGAGVAVNEDKFYLACGIADGHRGDHKVWLDVYDARTGKWSQLPDAPRARDHFQASMVDGKLYCLGGRTTIAADNPFKNTIGEVDVYDLQTQRWTTLDQPIPTKRAGSFNLPVGPEILVFGGESFTQIPAHAEVEALNTKTEQWRRLPPMGRGRHGTGAVWHQRTIYTASGCGNRGGEPELSDLWSFKY